MAKVRAYKLAEELGIERAEFMDKVRELGLEVRSHMAGLDEEQVEMLRGKLGGKVVEERVEKRTKSGAVIRRRRKKVEEPVAVAQPEVAAEEPVPEPQAAEPEAEPVVEQPGQPETEPRRPAEPAQLEPRPEQGRAPAPMAQRPMRPAEALPQTAGQDPRGAARRPVRRTHIEQVKLKEQEGLARTMLGNVQHRLEQRRSIVEQQSRDVRRRRPAGQRKKTLRAVGPRKKKIIRVLGDTSFKEIAAQTGVKVRDLVRRANALGSELDRDDRIDFEALQLLAEDIGYEVQRTSRDVEGSLVAAETPEVDLEPRPPVVTVMGHVDHGKTSLLDTIRKTEVAAGEAGGITQHIGAYQVHSGNAEITFLDTPGHAAFTHMRARGAQVTDVVVLVVAADDGVMPQTIEAINHARAAEVPIIIAVNKIDRPNADPQRVKQALLEHELVLEEFGGDVIGVEISATVGTNVDKLLEMLALQTEILELRARRTGHARGVVIEAQLDKGRGPVATMLVREGTLRRGDAFVAGGVSGRVRDMTDDVGNTIVEAGPSTPVQVVGISGVPNAGEEFVVVSNEREAKSIAAHRENEERRLAAAEASGPSMEDAFDLLGEGDSKELRVVVKADVRGTMEAICEASQKLSTDRVKLSVIHSGVGAITESDVMLASASNASVLGFHIRPEPAARKAAEREGVDIRTFDVVYELLDDVTALMSGLLPPKLIETVLGHAEVRQLFQLPRRGTVAGCLVADGVISRSGQLRVIRDSIPIYSGPVDSLRHLKDDMREIRQGNECGIRVANYDDYKVGDTLECYSVEETPDTL